MNERQSLAMLHFIVLIFGFTGILGREISLDAIPLVFWRVVIGGLGVMVWLRWKGSIRRLSPSLTLQVAGVGCIAAAHWVTFFHAIKVSNVSVALATLASAPVFVGLIEPLVHRRPFSRRELGMGLLVMVGLAILVDLPQFWADKDFGGMRPDRFLLGVGYALVSAALAATFRVLNALLLRKSDSANLARVELTAAAVALGLLLGGMGYWASPASFQFSLRDVVLLLLLGWVATSFAFLMSIEVMRQVKPFTVAVAINMEPVYAMVFAAWLYHEHEQMSVNFYLGAAVLVGVVFWDAVRRR
jgi:drug/metabolite transporter (DMT)-like permease